MKRCNNNPLITVKNVKPSRPDFHVEGIFNCGVCRFGEETLLVCRVSESAGEVENGVRIPMMTAGKNRMKLDVVSLEKDKHPEWDFSDSRFVMEHTPQGRRMKYLTSFSHLRLARSTDGVHFTVDDAPLILPKTAEESWGMEDPRVTKIGEVYYITYTAVSPQGPAAALMATKDFQSFQHLGVIFAPENKDTVIFPEKIGRVYWALNRPFGQEFGKPEMWISESPDLLHWGNQRCFCGTRPGWECGRIGGGTVPFRTEKGWLEFYHAADENDRYCIGALLLDAEHPEKILARTAKPLLQPEAAYETDGFFSDTVFTCGCCCEGDRVIMYYGAADDKICRADFTLNEIFSALQY